jgi:hypothetical protein
VREAAQGTVILIERRDDAVVELRPLSKSPANPRPRFERALAAISLRGGL